MTNDDSGKIRMVSVNGKAWYVAEDICRYLELGDTEQVVSRLRNHDKAYIGEGAQRTLIISGDGYLQLLFA